MVERITFHSEETGFAVLRVKVPKRKELVTINGTLSSISVGEHINAKGVWKNDSKYGLQFSAEFIRAIPPDTLEGIEKYLGSGLIKGIGPHFAKKLVSAFKEEVFDIIDNSPELLRKVEGIGRVRLEKITSCRAEQRIVREIMVFLQSHGVTTMRAMRIYKVYGDDAIKIVADNPYRLAKDISGIGFLTADKIAKNLGIEEDSIIRARAGVSHVLTKASSDGHCGLPKVLLLKEAEKLLGISQDIIDEALLLELGANHLIENTISGEVCVFLGMFYHLEKNIAFSLKEIAGGAPKWSDIDHINAIEWVEKKLSINLAENQKEAIKQAISSSFTVITGGPGTGKTTLLNSLLKILSAKNYKVMLCAPTGRAAKRLSETTGFNACTIHRLLKFNPAFRGFEYNQDNPLKCDLLIIDESSMVDVPLMMSILKAISSDAGLILVGDVDQLPSVGPGQVLKSIIDSEKFNVVKLTQIFRQAQNSDIILNAHKINQGSMPSLKLPKGESGKDFYFIESATPEDTVVKIIEMVANRIPRKFGFRSVQDIQVLSPMQRGGCGAVSLNIALQKALNKNIGQSITKYGQTFALTDKVMQTENNYEKEIYNGDIGVIKSIDVEDQEILITFDERDVVYDFSELDEITLAYAVTIHKSQGSEYKAVVIPINMQHFMMLRKNLLYTAVTRGKNLVILVGEKKAIAIAVKSKNNADRYTKLKEFLIY
jgi:exodeoxyribonuclease V alpha subunit